MYDTEVIKSYPGSFQKQAEVNFTSKKGTTSRDRELKKERIQHTEERKGRSRRHFQVLQS